jgi:hypothetical protein
MVILQHFGEDAHGRDGHGHASKSKETLYENFKFQIKKKSFKFNLLYPKCSGI